MSSSVYLRLKDGTLVAVLDDADERTVAVLRANLDKWMKADQAIEIAHASGSVDEVEPKSVEVIEIVKGPS